MDPEEIRRKIKFQPFEPVRLFISDGSYYDVHHPDQILITPRSAHIGLKENGQSTGLYQEVAVVANIHITRIELLKTVARRKR